MAFDLQVLYPAPFNDPSRPITYWQLDQGRRDCIDSAPPDVLECNMTRSTAF
jgi:hypothetical protein